MAGATRAIVLGAGDTLFYDLNGDNDAGDAGDFALITVSAGSGLFFFTNRVAGPLTGSFQPVELSGAALGDGFAGVIEGGVNGSIVTAVRNRRAFLESFEMMNTARLESFVETPA